MLFSMSIDNDSESCIEKSPEDELARSPRAVRETIAKFKISSVNEQ